MTGTLTVLILSLRQFLLFLQFVMKQKKTGMSILQSNSSYANLLFSHTKSKLYSVLITWNSKSLMWVIYGKYKTKQKLLPSFSTDLHFDNVFTNWKQPCC